MATRTLYDAVASEVLTAANLDTLAKGGCGHVTSTSTQTTTSSTEADMTSMTVTPTVPASRKIKVTAIVHALSSVDQDNLRLWCYRDATLLGHRSFELDTVTTSCQFSWFDSPSAGSPVYKITFARQSGTGTVTLKGDVEEHELFVEDVGGSF